MNIMVRFYFKLNCRYIHLYRHLFSHVSYYSTKKNLTRGANNIANNFSRTYLKHTVYDFEPKSTIKYVSEGLFCENSHPTLPAVVHKNNVEDVHLWNSLPIKYRIYKLR